VTVTVRSATTIILCLAAGLAAACGSDEEGAPIPAESASALENQLSGIEGRLAVQGACNDITQGDDPNTTVVDQLIADLPDDVDADVEQALRDGFDRLFQLVDERCAELEEEPDQTETEPPLIDTETETTPPEETVPEETVPEETIPAEPDPGEEDGTPPGQDGTPPGQDGEDPGQGNGGGALVPEGDG
jgi:hypothetical protein